MKTFCVQTLGCKVNQYESEQVVAALRARGWVETAAGEAELRIINSCSVTVQAASQSRQAARRMVRLDVLSDATRSSPIDREHPSAHGTGAGIGTTRPRVVVMGCWATSDKAAATSLPGVDAVLTHGDDVAAELDRLLTAWDRAGDSNHAAHQPFYTRAIDSPSEEKTRDGWMLKAGSAAGDRTASNKSEFAQPVNENTARSRGANSLPQLGQHQSGRQRAFLKIQDGCDAHCTYCIIPRLRPVLGSKPIESAVEEARRLVDAGHVEIVLTGIFLGAYGQATALRRRQPAGPAPLAALVHALCTRVPGLRRLRLSSLEPGDLTDDLLDALAAHAQVVPHFHLPLQSGSGAILRRMNRQYGRDDFLRMIDRVTAAFDRPALTTDVIVGFPGETDDEFEQTVQVVQRAGFIHVHAFPYSPRPGTAAARWTAAFVHGPVVNGRIDQLQTLGDQNSRRFRSSFLGETVEVITERGTDLIDSRPFRHGRCERYFAVHFDDGSAAPGEAVRLRVARLDGPRTFGARADVAGAAS